MGFRALQMLTWPHARKERHERGCVRHHALFVQHPTSGAFPVPARGSVLYIISSNYAAATVENPLYDIFANQTLSVLQQR